MVSELKWRAFVVRSLLKPMFSGRSGENPYRGHEDTLVAWSGPSCGVVPPKQLFSSAFILNRFYDLSMPGKYRIQVQRTGETSKVAVKSNTIEVTVTP